jgi:hypothetical protein
LLLSADEPEVDDLDFDDFRDELAAARVTAPVHQQPKPTFVKRAKSRKRPPTGLIIGAAAAVALVAVVLVMLQPGNDRSHQTVPGTQVAPVTLSTIPLSTIPTQTPPPAVRLELKPAQDNGTSVVLRWSSTKPLDYAVFMAEQGGKAPQTSYRGSGTSLTVAVQPGLKYCFEVQGTDGSFTYSSQPIAIRGATCKS